MPVIFGQMEKKAIDVEIVVHKCELLNEKNVLDVENEFTYNEKKSISKRKRENGQ